MDIIFPRHNMMKRAAMITASQGSEAFHMSEKITVAILLLIIGASLSIAFMILFEPFKQSSEVVVIKMGTVPGEFAPKGFYDPEVVIVKKGTAVTWNNIDRYPHSVDGYFDNVRVSVWISPGETWTYVFKEPGTYEYECMPCFCNPMKGKVIVID